MYKKFGPRQKLYSFLFPLTLIIIAANFAGVYGVSDPRDAPCVVKGKPKANANFCADVDPNCVRDLGIVPPPPAAPPAPGAPPIPIVTVARKADEAPDSACYAPVSDPQDALCVVKGKPKDNANYCADADPNCIRDLGIAAPTPVAPPGGGAAPAAPPNRARRADEAPDAACYLPANALKANHCKYTCAKCCELPEYECDDEASPILGKCDKKDCTNAAKKKYMEISCRSTCGLCNQPLPPDPTRPGCIDKVNCAPWKKYCTDPKYEKDLKENCARTCDFCVKGMNVTTTTTLSPLMATVAGTGAAVDLGQNCQANIDMCNNPLFRQIMQENCAATCRNAPPAPAGTTATLAPVIGRDISDLLDGLDCVDANPNCATWERRRNFCTSTFYTSQSKEDTCAKTCGYC
ncbi:shK domain-like domain-containing protein [Ditylenchus destructor]|nr:shK domain-like domain-containing protein [Ditylenchus destructor]